MSELIRVDAETKSALDKLKVIPRESYDAVIQRLISNQVHELPRGHTA